MLKELAAVGDPEAVSLMDALSVGLSPHEVALVSFLNAKSEELRRLGDLTSSAGSREVEP